MTNLNKDILTDIKVVAESGKTVTQIKGYLAFNYELTGKAATEYLVEAGLSTKTGSRAEILAFIEEQPRTEADLYKFVGTKSLNEMRWISQTNAIRVLANRIYEKHGVEIVEKAASDKVKAEFKAKLAESKK